MTGLITKSLASPSAHSGTTFREAVNQFGASISWWAWEANSVVKISAFLCNLALRFHPALHFLPTFMLNSA